MLKGVASKVLRWIAFGERGVCILAFCVLTAALFADVVSREFSGAGLHWSGQVGVYANILLVLAGFGLATGAGTHLRPRFVDGIWPAGSEAIVERLQYLLTALILSVLAVVAAQIVMQTRLLDERSLTLGWPVWCFQLALPLVLVTGAIKNLCFCVWPDLRPASLSAGQDT